MKSKTFWSIVFFRIHLEFLVDFIDTISSSNAECVWHFCYIWERCITFRIFRMDRIWNHAMFKVRVSWKLMVPLKCSSISHFIKCTINHRNAGSVHLKIERTSLSNLEFNCDRIAFGRRTGISRLYTQKLLFAILMISAEQKTFTLIKVDGLTEWFKMNQFIVFISLVECSIFGGYLLSHFRYDTAAVADNLSMS